MIKNFDYAEIGLLKAVFFILTFFGSIVSLRQIRILEIIKTKISPLRGAVFKMFGHKTPSKE
jgi:hypothetical protein